MIPSVVQRLGRRILVSILVALLEQVRGQHGGWQCNHCDVGEAFTELVGPQVSDEDSLAAPHSEVNLLFPAQVEVIPLTKDIGGWLDPSFHKKLAKEAIRGWRAFRDKIGPGLPQGHSLRNFLGQSHAGALNDAFFQWQKRLFEASGDFKASLRDDEDPGPTPHPDANSSWPEMQSLPEYRKLRKIVDRLSRRYLIRAGLNPVQANALNYSIFNWAAVHGPGEFHGPHTHVGEYHVGVFYAQIGPAGGKIRFGDPRGQSPPFGRSFFHTPKAGHLVFFPSWLSHMATVTAPSSDVTRQTEKEPYRVIFSFNIGPVAGPLPCHLWWSDPTGDMKVMRKSKIDMKAVGLEDL
mmetsp:Transcript_54406/g.126984  ORF Transcript_54406/g.126984 Transcript_54406/m.126984 type:complete len:350 (+) Transcript_54406:66-1115(+)